MERAVRKIGSEVTKLDGWSVAVVVMKSLHGRGEEGSDDFIFIYLQVKVMSHFPSTPTEIIILQGDGK